MLAKTIGGCYQIVNLWEKGNLVRLTLPKIGRSFGNPLCVVKQLKLKYNEPDTLQINSDEDNMIEIWRSRQPGVLPW